MINVTHLPGHIYIKKKKPPRWGWCHQVTPVQVNVKVNGQGQKHSFSISVNDLYTNYEQYSIKLMESPTQTNSCTHPKI